MLIMVKNSRKGKPGAWQRGEGVGHATSLPGTAWTCIATSGVHMGIIVKLSDVSGKRFNTHAVERNVARIGEG